MFLLLLSICLNKSKYINAVCLVIQMKGKKPLGLAWSCVMSARRVLQRHST